MPSAPDAPRLRFKPGVVLENLGPGGAKILSVVALAPMVLGFDITISCGEEGHGPADPHTGGDALDVRTKDLTPDQIIQAIGYFHGQLGTALFTVLFEVPQAERDALDVTLLEYVYTASNPDAAHIHLQVRKGVIFPAAPRP